MANPSAAHDIVNRERGTSADEFFDAQSYVSAFAPGRVNLLGEHTDYNDGFVLPIAISQQTTVAMRRNNLPHFSLHAAQLGQSVSFTLAQPPAEHFASYVFGCLKLAVEQGAQVPPLDIHVASEVPIGVGLSS
ncbi:MAG: galactokinase family protein, partial [Telluria sp.]